ncbi:MAG: hypothetical protein AB1631_22130 [Acidobacteriota bacterium]
MSEDRIQRQIEFIIEQQAKFTTDIDELKKSQQQTTEHITSLADAILSLTNIVSDQADQIAALVKQGKETDARLNTLIAIVERHISNPNAHNDET